MRAWPLLFVLASSVWGCSCGNNATGGSGGGGGFGSPSSSSGSAGGCPNGRTACGGACVDVTKDPDHCGACDISCGAKAQCCDSACVTTQSCAFAVTSVEPLRGMQSGGEWLTLHGAGFADGMRVHLGSGRAPTLVLDAHTARIQTPPGPVGKTDVRIDQGGNTATLTNGFEYGAAGLMTPWKVIPMSVVRGEDPGVAVLQDGRVLIAGGTIVPDDYTQSLASAEVFVRDKEKMLPAQGSMASARWQNNAVTLLSGKALVIGGGCLHDLSGCTGAPASADLFNPTTDSFTPTQMPMNMPRAYTRSVLMPDGRVFIASANDGSVEIYDPATDSFALVPHAPLHEWGFVVRLRDGRVLIGGGDGGNTAAEIYDPDTDTFSSVSPLLQGRSMVTAHTLPDGRVLVIGGASSSAGGIDTPLATMELFDPATQMFSAAPYQLSIGRCWHASALVRDGTVLVMGGYTVQGQCDSSVGTVDQVDPVQGTVSPFDALPMNKAATEWNAVTLLDGSIVAVGGGACGASMALPEVYFLPGAPIPN